MSLPTPGPYFVLVDVYPYSQGAQYTNFQLHENLTAGGGKYVPEKLPPYNPVVHVDGYTYRVVGGIPPLQVSHPALINVRVTTPMGSRRRSRPGSGRSATRSSSARATSPTSTRISAHPS